MEADLKPKIDFKRAEPSNASELIQWIERYYRYDHIAFDRNQLSALVPELLKNENFGLAYFIRLNHQTLGYFILTYGFDIEFGGYHAFVTDLYLDEASRRTGAGTAALRFIQAHCEQKKISTLILQVEIDNLEAQAFYGKAGFQKLDRHLLRRDFKKASP